MDRRKRLLAQALVDSRAGEIATCHECSGYALTEHMHFYEHHMVCPECDLPVGWYSKNSSSRGIRYYVFHNPNLTHKASEVRWSHPTPGNPLHDEKEIGQIAANKKKQKRAA